MLNIDFKPNFLKKIGKIKDKAIKERVKKQVKKIIQTPEIGKPMKFVRKGTREEYAKPLRLSYIYVEKENKLVFLELYHKDEQ